MTYSLSSFAEKIKVFFLQMIYHIFLFWVKGIKSPLTVSETGSPVQAPPHQQECAFAKPWLITKIRVKIGEYAAPLIEYDYRVCR